MDQKNKNNTIKNKQPVILFDIDYTLFDTALLKETNKQKFSAYDEVIGILNELSGRAVLGIFSEGDKEFQEYKLKSTKIHHYFRREHIFIVKNKVEILSNIGKIYKNDQLYIIDDKLKMLLMIKKYAPSAHTIWVKRGVYALAEPYIPNFEPDATVGDLKEIIPLL